MRAVVYGRVQGVGYRDYVQRHAVALRLGGWVRNREDGRSVEVHAVGDRATLERLLLLLREGPRFASVRDTQVQWPGPAERMTGFVVRY